MAIHYRGQMLAVERGFRVQVIIDLTAGSRRQRGRNPLGSLAVSCWPVSALCRQIIYLPER